MYDLIIIGMGPSGMSAGIYALRDKLKVLLIDEKNPGGLLNNITVVDNYLGFPNISGSDLAYNMFNHLNCEGAEYKIEKVLNIKNLGESKIITTTKSTYETKNIILSIGRKPKKSGIANEEKFEGKGISYCALCDGALYKDKDVLVLGGGNSAFEEALYLSKLVRSVKIIVRSAITADEELESSASSNNIETIVGSRVKEFLGNDKISGVTLDNGTVINCDGVFIYYGYEADTNFIKNLNITDSDGYIEVNNNMETKIKGIYACGDIIKKSVYQIITATSEGAIAAINIGKEINNK